MANLFRTSPEKQLARDIDAAKENRDRLAAKLADTEQAIARHTETARKLAVDGDDAGLDRAESDLRGAQDRRSTLQAAIADVERQLADFEKVKADNADRKQREATAAAIESIAREVIDAAAAFDAAGVVLADAATRATVIVFEASGVRNFALTAHTEVPAAGDMIATLLRTHASAVLDGTGPAALPKPEVPVAAPVIEKPPTVRLFALKPITWTDAAGQQRLLGRYNDVDLTEKAAAFALKIGACVAITDPRRKQYRGQSPGHPELSRCVNLDGETETTDQAAHTPADPITHAEFTRVDRGPPYTLRIASAREG